MRPASRPLLHGAIDPAGLRPESVAHPSVQLCDESTQAQDRSQTMQTQVAHADHNRKFVFELEPEQTFDKKLTVAKQDEFKSDFSRELLRLHAWATANCWQPLCVQSLQVTVSHRFKISRSLVPAWYGRAGEMEFPTRRVVAGQAAIAHELVHVFFPNGNRFLAEGLAIHLQAEIGGNPAFPNFGRPLHELARERMQDMVPERAREDLLPFEQIHLAALDEIATPNPLVLRVGENFFGEDARGQGHIYPVAGSFVQFLIEAYGLETFGALYLKTPFAPHAVDAGPPGRWIEVYGLSLGDLEDQWKARLVEYGETANGSV